MKKEYKKYLEDIAIPARQIYSRIKPLRGSENEQKTKTITELISNEHSLLTEQEKAELKIVGQNIDSKRNEMRRKILDQTTPLADKSQSPLIAKIEAKGGTIKYSSKIYNAIVAEVSVSNIEELSKDKDIYMIYNNNVLTAALDISTQAMGVNTTWWSNGYNGSSTDDAIIDTGIDPTHPNLSVAYADAFNILAVGNIYVGETPGREDDVLESSSGRGPTIYGMIKPDISTPGTFIMSTNNNWETEADFVSMSGTSMSAPHIAGAVLLIMDYMNARGQPETIKALLMNTAEDKGTTGPDNSYGYGYVDMSNAYIHRNDVINGTVFNSTGIWGAVVTADSGDSNTTNESGFYSIKVPPGSNYLAVTCEPEYYPNSSIPVNAISCATVVQDIEMIRKPTGTISGYVMNN